MRVQIKKSDTTLYKELKKKIAHVMLITQKFNRLFLLLRIIRTRHIPSSILHKEKKILSFYKIFQAKVVIAQSK